jgi:hypothetical protein
MKDGYFTKSELHEFAQWHKRALGTNPKGAMDAALARDDQEELSPLARKLLAFFKDKGLSPEDLEELQEILGSNLAADDPPDFPGKPLVGGEKVPLEEKTAQDRLPAHLRRYAPVGYSRKTLEDFNRRHPGAARIRVM